MPSYEGEFPSSLATSNIANNTTIVVRHCNTQAAASSTTDATPPRLPIIRRLSLRHVPAAAVDEGLRFVLPENHQCDFLYDPSQEMMTVQPRGCAHVMSQRSVTAYRCTSNIVADLIQPDHLLRIELINSSLLLKAPGLDHVTTIRLHESCLRVACKLATLHITLAVGSRVSFDSPQVAHCLSLRIDINDNNPANEVRDAYFIECYSLHGAHSTQHIDVRKLVQTAGATTEQRRRSRELFAIAAEEFWSRMLPSTIVPPADSVQQATDCCCICLANGAIFRYTDCSHHTLCHACLVPAMEDTRSFYHRKCPICRNARAPADSHAHRAVQREGFMLGTPAT